MFFVIKFFAANMNLKIAKKSSYKVSFIYKLHYILLIKFNLSSWAKYCP